MNCPHLMKYIAINTFKRGLIDNHPGTMLSPTIRKTAGFCLISFENKTKNRIEQVGYFMLCFFRAEHGIFVSGCWLCRHNWLTDLIEKRFHSFLYIQEKVFHCGKCWHKLTTVLAQIRSNFIQFSKGISLAFKKTPPQHDLRIVWKPLWTPFFSEFNSALNKNPWKCSSSCVNKLLSFWQNRKLQMSINPMMPEYWQRVLIHNKLYTLCFNVPIKKVKTMQNSEQEKSNNFTCVVHVKG